MEIPSVPTIDLRIQFPYSEQSQRSLVLTGLRHEMLVCGNEVDLFLWWHFDSPYLFSYCFSRRLLFYLGNHILIGLLVGDSSAYILLVSKDTFNIFIVQLFFYFLEMVVMTAFDQLFLKVLFIQLEAKWNCKSIISFYLLADDVIDECSQFYNILSEPIMDFFVILLDGWIFVFQYSCSVV